MFQETQDSKYLEVICNRIENVYLTWVEQFLDIIEEEFKEKKFSVNDIGCNVGQFWKGMKRRNLNGEYRGIDIEQQYLEITERYFPELKDSLFLMDVTTEIPKQADISVASATIEHFPQLLPGLDNILSSTNEMVVIRTFLGDSPEEAWMKKEDAIKPYIIHSYSFLEVSKAFEKNGFSIEFMRDRFTDSIPKYLGCDIVRTQYVIVGRRIKK